MSFKALYIFVYLGADTMFVEGEGLVLAFPNWQFPVSLFLNSYCPLETLQVPNTSCISCISVFLNKSHFQVFDSQLMFSVCQCKLSFLDYARKFSVFVTMSIFFIFIVYFFNFLILTL